MAFNLQNLLVPQGGVRSHEFRDTDFSGVDDRDEPGAPQSNYINLSSPNQQPSPFAGAVPREQFVGQQFQQPGFQSPGFQQPGFQPQQGFGQGFGFPGGQGQQQQPNFNALQPQAFGNGIGAINFSNLFNNQFR